MENVLELLDQMNVKYRKYEHEPVKTCAESTALLPKDIPGVRTKHLFVRDRKKESYFLIVIDETKLVDLKLLSARLNVKSLGMASEEELKRYLDVEVGAVSMLSLLNDREHRVRLLMDEAIWNEEAFDCHPNVNGIVLSIEKEHWMKIFQHMDRAPEVMPIPEKCEA